MIKFFRKIRQKSLSENKFGKYITYAIGEIVLVVIGILIALQINNLNEKQKLVIKTKDYYVLLLDDLKSDIKFSKHYLEESSIYLNEYKVYIDSYDKDVLNPIQFYEQISKLDLETPPLTFNTNTIESLQSTGDIGLIPSHIRNRLIDLKRLQTLTVKRFEDTDDGKSEITQNLSRLLGATTLPKRLENQPKMKEFLNIDENLRMLILVYEGIHRWKYLSLQETKGRLEEMQKEINTLIEIINKEITKAQQRV
jgi:hypothetical protein